jgi:hypothetical protein
VQPMTQNFLPLDNEYNVLALLQQGYSFIEPATTHETEQCFIVGIPHTERPEDREYQLLSQFLVKQPSVTFRVDKRYFGN